MTRLVLRGGHVLDPAAGVDGAYDVVIDDDRISELAPAGADVPGVDELIDVTGALVTPGLIDLHGHWWEGSPYGVDPRINLRGGVTCAVDAGTAGFSTFGAFRRFAIDSAPVRMLAFVHVAAAGLVATVVGELEDIRYARPRETAAIIDANRDVVVGVKVRHRDGRQRRQRSRAALDAALEAAELAGVPLMAHIAEGADVRRRRRRAAAGRHRDPRAHRVRPGHPRRGRPACGRRCGPRDAAGSGSTWATAAAASRGRRPRGAGGRVRARTRSAPTSTATPIERPVVDLPTTMSQASRPRHVPARGGQRPRPRRPAAVIGHPELGTLRPGDPADVDRPAPRGGPVGPAGLHTASAETVARPAAPELTIVAGAVTRPRASEVRSARTSTPTARWTAPSRSDRVDRDRGSGQVPQPQPVELDAVRVGIAVEHDARASRRRASRCPGSRTRARCVERVGARRVELAERTSRTRRRRWSG